VTSGTSGTRAVQILHHRCEVWGSHGGGAAGPGTVTNQRPVLQHKSMPRSFTFQLWWQVGVGDGTTQSMWWPSN